MVVFTFVRFGSARLLGPVSVSRRVGAGDVVVLGPGELCGVCPTPQVTATMLAVDEALLVDLVFWRHEAGLVDRWDWADPVS